MQLDILGFFLVIVLGCAAFLFSIGFVIVQAFTFMGRTLYRALFGGGWAGDQGGEGGVLRVCPRCRKAERRPARFCSQCGLRFPDDRI